MRQILAGNPDVELAKAATIKHVTERLQGWRFEDVRDAYSGLVLR